MKKQTIGVCVIVKNEERNIVPLIDSLYELSPEAIYLTDTGSTDKTLENAQRAASRNNFQLSVSNFEWCDDFAKARNFNFSQAKTDWILWLDADDTLENGNNLRNLVEKANQIGVDGLYLPYRYQVEPMTQKDVVVHSKLRAVKNGKYAWTEIAPIHENLFPIDKSQSKVAYDETVKVRHWRDESSFKDSGKRNIRILEALRAKELAAGKPDQRTIFLLGREYDGQGNKDKAIEYLKLYLTKDKYGGDALQANGILATIYERMGDFGTELDYAFDCVKALPDHPLGYINVARAYSNLGEYKLVIDWIKKSMEQDYDISDGTMQLPYQVERQQAFLLADAMAELEEYDKAAEALKKYLNWANSEDTQLIYEHVGYYQAQSIVKKQRESFTILSNIALKTNRYEALKGLLLSMYGEAELSKESLRLQRAVGMGVERQNNITIFCGLSAEEWDDKSLEVGLGGSETAVVEMSRRWANMGYEVHIYNTVSEPRSYGNVKYFPYNQINWADKFDIFISWRNPLVVKNMDISARKKYIWLHDVPNPMDYNKKLTEKVDRIIVLSEFHRNLLPAVSQDKFYISRNGIDIKLIDEVLNEGIERDPSLIVYTSAPDRGLDRVIKVWDKVRINHPEAKVQWAYGWETFNKLRGGVPELMRWKKELQRNMQRAKIQSVGRLGKRDLYRLYAKAGIWFYPTVFDEISCISAMEAQALGCYPVTSGHAALAETQQIGIKEPDLDKIANKLDSILSAGVPVERFDRDMYSWDLIAKEWANDLFHGDVVVKSNPLVSLVFVTTRPGCFRILKEQMEKQTYKNMELVIIDGRYQQRKDQLELYFKGFPFKWIHLPDPQRDMVKYPYGLSHAYNAGLHVANGELLVFLQDFIEMADDGVERFVDLYRLHPEAIYSGVDDRVGFKGCVNKHNLLDVFEMKKYELYGQQFKSPRIKLGNATRISYEPMEWELNWAAAPRDVLVSLGGWDNTWDTAFGYDNTQLALRHVANGGYIILDEKNMVHALSHWDIFPNDDLGVPNRGKKTNDKRYATYIKSLMDNPNVPVDLVYEPPVYISYFVDKIAKWKLNNLNQLD
jgi:glycosyltransferase involved in cell wall biosynthesis